MATSTIIKREVCHEYCDGSYIKAVIVDGKITECPAIRLCPPAEPGTGGLSLSDAIYFLSKIKEAIEETAEGRG